MHKRTKSPVEGIRVTFQGECIQEVQEAIAQYSEGLDTLRELDNELRAIHKYGQEGQKYRFYEEEVELDHTTIEYARMLISKHSQG